jgi:hypothetical protein
MIQLLSIGLCFYFFYLLLLEIFIITDEGSFPPKLGEIRKRFIMGKPPRKFHHTLRIHEPTATSHYCKVPGRLTCVIRPYNANGEKLWQLVVGFKETSESKPTHFCQIPVYADGQIYDV